MGGWRTTPVARTVEPVILLEPAPPPLPFEVIGPLPEVIDEELLALAQGAARDQMSAAVGRPQHEAVGHA